jgi:membrane associated rhomboid family serine protease
MAVELVLGVTGTQEGVAHFAHLGGAAAGFVLLRYWRAQALRRRD